MNKTITMNFEEYKDLLEQLERLKEFIRGCYNIIEHILDEEAKSQMIEFMQKYCDWL